MKLSAAALALCALLPVAANAHQAGDFFIRGGSATVVPTGNSDDVLGLGGIQAKNNTQLGLTFTYMLSDNVAVELLGATPFRHKVQQKTLGEIATVKQLPPSLMAEWYFDGLGNFSPYAGLGINYTRFFQERFNDNAREAGLSDLHLKDSWGWAGVVGLDYQLPNNWLLNASVWYMDIDTDADFDAGPGNHQSIHTNINPVVFFFGLGYTF